MVVNKPFKDRIRAMYKDWIENQSLNRKNITKQANIKASNDLMIEWALNALRNLDTDMIRNSFKTCGIFI